jgi:signal transduction histidine kinase
MAACRILHVEDSPDDALLVSRSLARAGFEAEIARVDSEAAYRAELGRGAPDVILCDYDLPGFSAEGALAIMRESAPGTPFIVVSNHIDQSSAVVAMQQGASDYLSKRDLGRLAKAIGGALERAAAQAESARAERALRDSEAMMRGILESLDSRIAVLDPSGRIVAANSAWERFAETRLASGFPPAKVGNDYIEMLEAGRRVGHPSAEAGLAALRSVMAGEKSYAAVDYRLDTPAGTVWFVARAMPLQGSEGGVVIAHQDVTDRMLAHLALEEANRQLQTLSKRVLSIQEEERRAISRELHDDAGQSLAALKIGLHRLAQSPAPDRSLLSECIDTAEQVIDKLRRMAQELRPPQLDQFGLAEALRWLAERQSRATGIEIACEFRGAGERRHPPLLESACYRIAQEAISNATRHARARRIVVGVEGDKRLLKLAISDDGEGFDEPAARRRAAFGGSIGLISMEERALLAGGRLKIRTVAGRGTTISAQFPLVDAGS